jgi:hypothetical protein
MGLASRVGRMSLGGGALALGGCRGLRCLGGACELGGGLVGPSGWAGWDETGGWVGGGVAHWREVGWGFDEVGGDMATLRWEWSYICLWACRI